MTCNFESLGFIMFAFKSNTLKWLKPLCYSQSQLQVNRASALEQENLFFFKKICFADFKPFYFNYHELSKII